MAAGTPRSTLSSPSSSPACGRSTSRPRARTGSLTSSIAADRRAFLRVIDETTLAFADFAGNRQYITTGNLAENPRAMLFLMDYQHRRRVKIWGQARVIENDPELIARLFPDGLQGAPRSRDPVHGRSLGCELPAAHPANAVCRRCRSRDRSAQRAHRGARGRKCEVAGRSGLNRTRYRVRSCPELAAYLCISIKSGVVPVDDPPAPVP